jgi:hypothetical protein
MELRRTNSEDRVWPEGITFDLSDDEFDVLRGRMDSPLPQHAVLVGPRILAEMTFGIRDLTLQGRRDLIAVRAFDTKSFDFRHTLSLALHIARHPTKAVELLLKD